MSRHKITARDPAHKVIVGWDLQLQTFFAQIIDRRAEPVAERAKAAEKARRRGLVVVPIDLSEMRDAAMLTLSRLSTAAQAAGDERTMYAANRAWRELDRAKRHPEPDLAS